MAVKLMEKLWSVHHIPGETVSFHGDMSRAFGRMLADPLCDSVIGGALRTAIYSHCRLERTANHCGRKWFCEVFGTAGERAQTEDASC